MEKLLQDCWDLLKQNTNLYFAPVIMLLSGLFIENTGFSFVEMISLSAVVMINMAISVGWINQIKTVIIDKRNTTFDDLLEGIGKYFGKILSGNIFLMLLIATFFMIFMLSAGNFVDLSEAKIKEFASIFEKMNSLKQDEISNYVLNLNPDIKDIILKIGVVFITFLSISGIFYFFIALWTQCLIINDLSWLNAWKKSISMVMSNFLAYSIFTVIETVIFSIIVVLTLLIKDPLSQIILLIFNIVCKTYFMVLFSLFVFKFDKDRKIEILENDLQSSVS